MKKIAVYLIKTFLSKDFILITLENSNTKQRKAEFKVIATLDVKAVCKEIIKSL